MMVLARAIIVLLGQQVKAGDRSIAKQVSRVEHCLDLIVDKFDVLRYFASLSHERERLIRHHDQTAVCLHFFHAHIPSSVTIMHYYCLLARSWQTRPSLA